ncbi:HotDog domain-containing protein [Aspergillus cavernicola]|uniref:HotDog domain-containing protein n=1 Tax=Aspergillus cavernicola TaxID=176166 RepID=A0ABR4IAD5_9EURO
MPTNYPKLGYTEIPTYSRHPKPATGEDGFFAQTISSPITIPLVRTYKLTHLQSLPLPSQPPPWPSPTSPPEPIPVPGADLVMVLQLASPGVCGHPDTAHGGVLATVIDEAMSLGVTLYAPEAGESGEDTGGGGGRIRSKMFTAQLDVRFKRPVAVPGEIEGRVRILAKQGKKVWVRAQVVQEDEIMVDAMAFWLLTSPAKSVL